MHFSYLQFFSGDICVYTGVQSVKFVVHDLQHKRLLRVQSSAAASGAAV